MNHKPSMTTRVLSVSVPVSDQDAALKFYTEVLGCELRTPDAQQAHAALRDADVALDVDELVRMEGLPAMFVFADPDGNDLVYLEDSDPATQ